MWPRWPHNPLLASTRGKDTGEAWEEFRTQGEHSSVRHTGKFRQWKPYIWLLLSTSGVLLSGIQNRIWQGGTWIWTRDLLICSQMLYPWAIPPPSCLCLIGILNLHDNFLTDTAVTHALASSASSYDTQPWATLAHLTATFSEPVATSPLWGFEWEWSTWVIYLNTWSPVGGIIWERLGGSTLLKEMCHWGLA